MLKEPKGEKERKTRAEASDCAELGRSEKASLKQVPRWKNNIYY
jgi:hypothetical protein